MVRHNLSSLKSFLLEEKGYWGRKERNGREELTWSVLRAFRKETESVGKNEEEEAKGVGGFKSGVSVGIYFRVLKELAKAIFVSLVLYFLRTHGGRERGSERTREGQRWMWSVTGKEENLLIIIDQVLKKPRINY